MSKKPAWYKETRKYEKPDLGKAIWQLINTFVPYLVLWYLMVRLLEAGVSYWLVLPLIVLAAGFSVRIFIFFHDCGHASFFASQQANTVLGYVAGTLTFTPYREWSHAHRIHHATAGNLDRRDVGDVWTMTLQEYLEAPRGQRFLYRVVRNPWVMFLLGPIWVFLLSNRIPKKGSRPREKLSVHITNLGILAIILLATATIGFKTYFIIQFPVIYLAAVGGIWLFYVQHQFEGVYWARQEQWDPIKASLEGSSYYKLPKVLQWFSGNIGFHHIHHIRPRIPNYRLEECCREMPVFQKVKPLTPRESLKSLRMNLWDEAQQKLVSFSALKSLPEAG